MASAAIRFSLANNPPSIESSARANTLCKLMAQLKRLAMADDSIPEGYPGLHHPSPPPPRSKHHPRNKQIGSVTARPRTCPQAARSNMRHTARVRVTLDQPSPLKYGNTKLRVILPGLHHHSDLVRSNRTVGSATPQVYCSIRKPDKKPHSLCDYPSYDGDRYWERRRLLRQSRPASVVLEQVELRRAREDMAIRPTMVSVSRPMLDMSHSSRVARRTQEMQHSGFILSSSGRARPNRFRSRAVASNSTSSLRLGWVRQRTAVEHNAATLIQATQRGLVARRNLRISHEKATIVQSQVRAVLGRKLLRRLHGKASAMQAVARGWKVRQVYSNALRQLATERRRRTDELWMGLNVVSRLKPRAKKFMRMMRERKEEAGHSLKVHRIAEKLREVAKKAMAECGGGDPNCDGSSTCTHNNKSPKEWTLKWGKLELSKKRVRELSLDMERVHREWLGGKIVRIHDGSFRAAFDPGDDFADWMKQWMDPQHYSHAGVPPRTGKVVTLKSIYGQDYGNT